MRAWRSSEYAPLIVAADQRLLERQAHAEAAERHGERHRRREPADVALMADDLTQLPAAVRLARFARRLIAVNVTASLGVKILFVVLALFGVASLWLAILADVGVLVAVTINGMRPLRYGSYKYRLLAQVVGVLQPRQQPRVYVGCCRQLDGVLMPARRQLQMPRHPRIVDFRVRPEFQIEISLARMHACEAAVLFEMDRSLLGRFVDRAEFAQLAPASGRKSAANSVPCLQIAVR